MLQPPVTFMNEKKPVFNDSEWENVGRSMRTAIDFDKVYCRYEKTKHGTMRMHFSIGNDIAAMLGWIKGDSVQIIFNRSKPCMFRIFLCDDRNYPLYTLYQPKQSHSVNTAFKTNRPLKMEHDRVMPVYFDIFGADLFIDLSQPPKAIYQNVGIDN